MQAEFQNLREQIETIEHRLELDRSRFDDLLKEANAECIGYADQTVDLQRKCESLETELSETNELLDNMQARVSAGARELTEAKSTIEKLKKVPEGVTYKEQFRNLVRWFATHARHDNHCSTHGWISYICDCGLKEKLHSLTSIYLRDHKGIREKNDEAKKLSKKNS